MKGWNFIDFVSLCRFLYHLTVHGGLVEFVGCLLDVNPQPFAGGANMMGHEFEVEH